MTGVKQAVVTTQAALNPSQGVEKLALFNTDGTPYGAEDAVYNLVTTATAIGTAAKTTTSPEPSANTLVPIKFTNGNSADLPTVAFNGGTARAIRLAGTAVDADNLTLAANGVALFWFDGTILHQIGRYS